jgi:platelet-activating factor acetylhydrolase
MLLRQELIISWKEGEDSSLARWGRLQLEMRVREVYETYHSFRQLLAGSKTDKSGMNRLIVEGNPDDGALSEWLESFKGHVDVDNVILTGHSFGGGTMVSFKSHCPSIPTSVRPADAQMHLLKTPPPDTPNLPPIPAKKCIALDPWLETLPVPAPPTPDSPDIPLLVVNSPGFTAWKPHFERLLKQVGEANGTLLTLLGSERESSWPQLRFSSLHSMLRELDLADTPRPVILRLSNAPPPITYTSA